MKAASSIAKTEESALNAATAVLGGAPAKPAASPPKKGKRKKKPPFREKGARDTSDKY